VAVFLLAVTIVKELGGLIQVTEVVLVEMAVEVVV
jgi:hypothetical protein